MQVRALFAQLGSRPTALRKSCHRQPSRVREGHSPVGAVNWAIPVSRTSVCAVQILYLDLLSKFRAHNMPNPLGQVGSIWPCQRRPSRSVGDLVDLLLSTPSTEI